MCNEIRTVLAGVLIGALAAANALASPQTQAPPETPTQTSTTPLAQKLSFNEAIERAVQRNPSVAVAAADILRAEGLLKQARANTLVTVLGNATSTTISDPIDFDDETVIPRTQVSANLSVAMPLFAPALWARRAQAKDNRHVAELNVTDVRRQIAIATADAYLNIIGVRRVIDVNERARDVARAHYELARQLREAGTGSRLNEVRAEQQVSADEVLVEAARNALYRAQEALGVLLAAGAPIDAGDEPAFEIPAETPERDEARLGDVRTDILLFSARQDAANRVLRDSWKDYLPSVAGLFEPSVLYPEQIFQPQRSWRAVVLMSVPIWDSGQRSGVKMERQASFDETRAALEQTVTQARSEVRAAYEAVASAERALVHARAAAQQASSVVDIVNVSYRAGVATNIEVIEAQKQARDADNIVAVAEDNVRRARLDLLAATGRFP
jgi:outer membrane protein TolC